ncbi:MAG: hypothetical protein A2836_03345 [Candidatus Taylorbacteria bacterium RIFCSPHIGHO2_01_FULL_45_63]|uniref:Uncharacterized protein n=1 Tax=Candidatus Taylorbacteria bacterium RIFCSPHIGHO2_02_FULL_45_35 TaxID=1802311 RepID=A0A1G2MPW5_9BACT|nr:MAG: hypothetical protein A2836_03345 [Candidatus Taylorbacteria bacterium RIFCSPHIGHO2_01_FULL_45_63]OHA25925.1 MAG: hypothetical protein A3D56_02465 [Candidatus Taylorbacteria bacterium RIFCSPHIGHO2_02_FULL_45_35]OHA34750.1 MAG: hypothetical protein A3A22_00770 [Candidatus Taylorbacteria bacterium RIFCSPLOWO2_01_FULL_45_34b]
MTEFGVVTCSFCGKELSIMKKITWTWIGSIPKAQPFCFGDGCTQSAREADLKGVYRPHPRNHKFALAS